jgi:hypothetical protein
MLKPPSGVQGSRSSPQRRIPVRLHRNVSLIKTSDAHLAEELLARKKLAGLLAGRLTDQVLLVRPGLEAAVIEELRKIGQTPQVIRGGNS